jgi:hypothetical protein
MVASGEISKIGDEDEFGWRFHDVDHFLPENKASLNMGIFFNLPLSSLFSYFFEEKGLLRSALTCI